MDFECNGQLYHVGARFKALFMSNLVPVSDLGCIFFVFLTSGLEQYAHLPVPSGYDGPNEGKGELWISVDNIDAIDGDELGLVIAENVENGAGVGQGMDSKASRLPFDLLACRGKKWFRKTGAFCLDPILLGGRSKRRKFKTLCKQINFGFSVTIF